MEGQISLWYLVLNIIDLVNYKWLSFVYNSFGLKC